MYARLRNGALKARWHVGGLQESVHRLYKANGEVIEEAKALVAR